MNLEQKNYLVKLQNGYMSAKHNSLIVENQHKEYSKLELESAEIDNLKSDIVSYLHSCNMALDALNKTYAEFKASRLSEVSEYISGALAVVFPDREYDVNLEADDPSSRSRTIALSLQDKYGNTRYPFVTEGMLNNQLIAYSAAFALVKAFGYNTIYIDEAFSAAHPSNLKKTAKQVEDAVMDGMQVFLIQQAEEGYEEVPRREIYLKHTMDPASDGIEHTVVESVVDYGGADG